MHNLPVTCCPQTSSFKWEEGVIGRFYEMLRSAVAALANLDSINGVFGYGNRAKSAFISVKSLVNGYFTSAHEAIGYTEVYFRLWEILLCTGQSLSFTLQMASYGLGSIITLWYNA